MKKRQTFFSLASLAAGLALMLTMVTSGFAASSMVDDGTVANGQISQIVAKVLQGGTPPITMVSSFMAGGISQDMIIAAAFKGVVSKARQNQIVKSTKHPQDASIAGSGAQQFQDTLAIMKPFAGAVDSRGSYHIGKSLAVYNISSTADNDANFIGGGGFHAGKAVATPSAVIVCPASIIT